MFSLVMGGLPRDPSLTGHASSAERQVIFTTVEKLLGGAARATSSQSQDPVVLQEGSDHAFVVSLLTTSP